MDKIINHKYIEYTYKTTLLILLIINMIILPSKEIKFECKLKETKKDKKPIIINYQLFNQTDERFFSLILDFSNSNLNLYSEKFIIFMTNITKQTFKDIQILFIYNSSNHNITNKFIEEGNIEIYSNKSEIWSKNFLDLTQRVKGKFLFFINNIVRFEIDEFYKIYNKTKGSIQNIFEFTYDNNQIFYLFRIKKIKEIIDSELKFNNYEQLINYIKRLSLYSLNYIPVAYCPNNYYTTLTYTSMLSILATKHPYTYILFYLIITKDFTKKKY